MVHRGSDNVGLTVNSTHLISICMTSNDDGFLPTGDETRDVLADDGLSEDTPRMFLMVTLGDIRICFSLNSVSGGGGAELKITVGHWSFSEQKAD